MMCNLHKFESSSIFCFLWRGSAVQKEAIDSLCTDASPFSEMYESKLYNCYYFLATPKASIGKPQHSISCCQQSTINWQSFHSNHHHQWHQPVPASLLSPTATTSHGQPPTAYMSHMDDDTNNLPLPGHRTSTAGWIVEMMWQMCHIVKHAGSKGAQ